jgi:hypothetical protein
MVDLMFLLDTNIFLELLLNQENADEVRDFLVRVPLSDLSVSAFSLYSIGILLVRQKQYALYTKFLNDVVGDEGMRVIVISEEELGGVSSVAERFSLDFDDAYQYTVAKNNDLVIVSFDRHFDITDRGRRTPAQIRTE